MKKAEHSFLTLTICVVAAMFIGLTVLACGKTTGTDLSSQPKTLTINNTTIYDLTDLHFICNNDSSSNEELSLVKAGSSETVELPRMEHPFLTHSPEPLITVLLLPFLWMTLQTSQ